MYLLPIDYNSLAYLIVILTIVTLITSEYLSLNSSSYRFLINKERLKNVALFLTILSVGVILVRIYTIILTL
jgi:hypothetical protein